MTDRPTNETRAEAMEFVREFKGRHGYDMSPAFEDELIRAIEDKLDECGADHEQELKGERKEIEDLHERIKSIEEERDDARSELADALVRKQQRRKVIRPAKWRGIPDD